MTHSNTDDLEFERRLLDAGRSDALPGNETEIWATLSASLASAALLAGPSSLGHAQVALPQARQLTALRWLGAGVLLGGASVALLLHGGSPALSSPAPPPRSAPFIVQLTPVDPLASTLPTPGTATPAPNNSGAGAPRFAPKRRSLGLKPRVSTAPAADSSLSAQVELLDAARVAVAAGATLEALRLVNQYRSDFPNGELAPEAELVALEALAARGDRSALQARAARFMARYPGDPHTERVQRLAR